MLVLSRKADQYVQIGDQITVKVVKIKGSTIQLGIEAPRDVAIVRSELIHRDLQQDESQRDQLDRENRTEVDRPAATIPMLSQEALAALSCT